MKLDNIKAQYRQLLPGQRKKLTIALIVLMAIIGSVIYYAAKPKLPPPKPAVVQQKPLQVLEPGALKKDDLTDAQTKAKLAVDQNKEIMGKLHEHDEQFKQIMEGTFQSGSAPSSVGAGSGKSIANPPTTAYSGTNIGAAQGTNGGTAGNKQANGSQPIPPFNVAQEIGGGKQQGFSQFPGISQQPYVPAPQAPMEPIGDIGIATNPYNGNAVSDDKDKKKEVRKKVYLPVSFMPGTLLTGAMAPAYGAARGNPVPMLIRITDLSILPNNLRQNLKGCFVLGEAMGDLATERAKIRLTNLTCLTNKGRAVIDAKIKGYIVDNDSIIGIKGRVVSKMGEAIVRTAVAGLFAGAGDAFRAAQTVTTVTAVGPAQTVSGSQVLRAGLGQGVADAAHELQHFYLDLAKETVPVVEVLPVKDVTIIVTEGVDLEIRKVCKGGLECES